MSGRAAVFVDRDGVIDELVPDPVTGRLESPLHPDDVHLLPGVAAAISDMQRAGYFVVSVSNQPAAAKGTVSADCLGEVHRRVVQLLLESGAALDDSEWCLHHPDAVVAGLRGPCDCRKPQPGMLLASAAKHGVDLASSWMVGDTDADIEAGRAAGCHTVLVEHPGSSHKRGGTAGADHRAADIREVARIIVSSTEPR